MKKYLIGKSKIHGKGIILNQNVKKDELIFIFTEREVAITSNYWFHKPCALQVGYTKWIVPRPSSAGEFLNHSCSPTAGVRGRNRIVAIRSLKKGEEVTIDYALSETFPLWHMRCHCRARNCRLVVKPYQDLSPQRMKKYVKYTSKYILDLKMHVNWGKYLAMEQKNKTKRKPRV